MPPSPTAPATPRRGRAGRGPGEPTDALVRVVSGAICGSDSASGSVRDGGVISRVGVPQYTEGPIGMDMNMRNTSLTGGVAPARAYIGELLPDVLDGRIEPGKVFDRTVGLDDVPAGYRAMADREALKVVVRP